ncbi:hypothetical protein JR338_06050 [Chloroflexota bacterium]|nr:hypothetical protein JR338_06050 [Chloroflexota bacterium]
MATYREIQDWVKKHHGGHIKTCWIADMKEECGLPVRVAANRQGPKRLNPCPDEKKKIIKKAFRHFGMIR